MQVNGDAKFPRAARNGFARGTRTYIPARRKGTEGDSDHAGPERRGRRSVERTRGHDGWLQHRRYVCRCRPPAGETSWAERSLSLSEPPAERTKPQGVVPQGLPLALPFSRRRRYPVAVAFSAVLPSSTSSRRVRRDAAWSLRHHQDCLPEALSGRADPSAAGGTSTACATWTGAPRERPPGGRSPPPPWCPRPRRPSTPRRAGSPRCPGRAGHGGSRTLAPWRWRSRPPTLTRRPPLRWRSWQISTACCGSIP